MRIFSLRSVKTHLVFFLLIFAVVIAARDKSAAILIPLVVASAVAVFSESLVLYLRTRAFSITESSLITGLIVGYVVSGDEPLWRISLVAVLAIALKHLLRVRRGPLFNPAALGIFVSIVCFGIDTQWQGTYVWQVLAPVGVYLAYRTRKVEILVGYFIASFLLFGAQAIRHHSSLGSIFGYFSYFYIFVMAIEPKTTPSDRSGKIVFGAGLAVLIFVLTEVGVRFDVELFSLLAMNAAVPLLSMLSTKRGGRL